MGGLLFELKEYLKFTAIKKSTTLAGALVFFTLLGLVPTVYVLSLAVSLLGEEFSSVFQTFISPEFEVVGNYLIESAKRMGAGGNFIAVAIALYSSANVFYHLRLSGEMLYNFKSGGGLFIRLIAVFATVTLSLTIALFAVVYTAFSPFLVKWLKGVGSLINIAVALITAFIAVVFINLYTCPYKLKLREVFKGSLFTCIFGAISTTVFFFYVKYFASYEEVYGAIATVLVLLTYLFLVMKSLVGGITLNVFLLGRNPVKNSNTKVNNTKKLPLMRV